ncbi:MAG: helix-turn-helix domain-containing protein, partial [bacterium]|nr:helix-turn-helix domain-containing protein [bacterium]
MLTIAQAAQYLKVSTKTLRRWETQGILIPHRTTGNQRRYEEEQIKGFKKPSHLSLSPLTPA